MVDQIEEKGSEEEEKVECAIVTRDRLAVIALMLRGHLPNKIDVIETDRGNQVLMFNFTKEAERDFQAWMSDEPYQVDYHKAKAAESNWKGFLRGYLP